MVTSIYLPDSVHGLLELESTLARQKPGSFVSRAVQSALTASGTLAGTVLAVLRAQPAPLTVESLASRCTGFTQEAIEQALKLLAEDTPSAPARVAVHVLDGVSRYACVDPK